MANEYDLMVIGSGPGGYVAAIRAAQLGLKAAVVEKDPAFGGTCLHRGCIPTKALLHTATMLDEIRHAETIGIDVATPKLDLDKTHEYKNGVVNKNAKGIEFLFKKNKIDGLHGFGRVVGQHQVEVEKDGEKTVYQTRYILIATGSVPREIPLAPTDGVRILNSDHILKLDHVPGSLAVLGAGAVGSEFASIYRAFGSEVTLIEMLPRLLPIEDEDVSKELARNFKKRGIKALTNTRLSGVENREDGVLLTLGTEGKDPSQLLVDTLLVAVGRAPVSEGLGLEVLGVEIERGYIRVNEYMQTGVPNIYAIGDVVNTPWLAHVASSEGIVAVEHMAEAGARPIDYNRVPSCTYCDPEVASVGLTESRARELGHDIEVGKFPFSALAKAGILKRNEGFVKIIRETRYDEILGVHIIGPHATDLIAEACLALQVESTNEELFRTMHAHPTLSEAMAEAAHAATGHSIHF